MASKPVLDLEALLAPIPGDNPAGADLMYEPRPKSAHDQIKELLPKSNRDALSDEGGQEGKWAKIVEVASQFLRKDTKDLAIAGWLTQAIIHRHGFAGVRDGLLLIDGLCERFWDHVYPVSEPEEQEPLASRAGPLHSLFGDKNAGSWIREIPLASAPIRGQETDELIACSYNLYYAIVVKQLADRKPLHESMEKAIRSSPNDFITQLSEDLKQATDALAKLRDTLNQKFEKAAPSTVGVAAALADCQNRIDTELERRGLGGPKSDPDDEPVAASLPQNGHAPRRPETVSGPIQTREDALERLREVADFFRLTQPHSPVPYLIQRAINWSRMSFDQLMLELVKDENSRTAINSTLGISLGETTSTYGDDASSDESSE